MSGFGAVRDTAALARLAGGWEQAYRDYMAAWESFRVDHSAVSARNAANAARRVARAWHELSRLAGLPWWCVAALAAAAEAFSDTAQRWARRAGA